jgi:23S rRNA pseudouridine1911/1915/1917 synthase
MKDGKEVVETALNQGWIYRDRVESDGAGSSLLDFYATRYTHSTRAEWAKRITAGQIRVDAQVADNPEKVLTKGRTLAYHRAPWSEAEVPTRVAVVLEDEDLLIVDKPAGLPVLPGGNFLEHTLLWMLRARHGATVAPLHRLGRGTSGLIAFAKSEIARRQVSGDFASGDVEKTYRALVNGRLRADELAIDAPIGRVPYPPLGRVFAAVDASASERKMSRSEVRVLEYDADEDESLVEVRIPTGRPHQIRIHLAAVGHPLVGEPLYASGGQPRPLTNQEPPPLPGDGGFHLHSARIRLRHPAKSSVVVSLWSLPPVILRTQAELGVGDQSS